MKKMFKKTAALVLVLLAFATPASAGAGGEGYETDVKEERAIVDEWVAPHAKGNPSFAFYKNRSGFAKLKADNEAWTHFRFFYDSQKSEYLLSSGTYDERIGTARIIRAKGEPDRLAVRGEFIDHADRLVKFDYELVRAADARKAGASLPAGEYSILKPEPHWMLGDWSAGSGDPMTVNVRGYGGTVSLFSMSVPGGWDAGGDINLSAKLRWDAGRKAFEIWTGSVFSREGRIVVSDQRKWGYVWPSSGKDASSETLRIEFNSHGQTFRAVLKKEKKTLAALPEETLQKLRGTWVSQSGMIMKIVLGKSEYESKIYIGDMLWRLVTPQWDTEVSKIVFFCAEPAWKGEPVKGPDGVIYGKDRDFRLCTAELSKDGKTLTLAGVHGFNSFKMPHNDMTKSGKPVPFTSVLVKGNKKSQPRGDYTDAAPARRR
ncbi:MAG: hypothetical protein LBR94_01215 [Desulfovibrio sp.]|jgi:hypothetical protein|nr:hypothetical protein [Desulfovibrio sp.]